MSKLQVGIICGGVSSECDISLQSAESIFRVIDYSRFKVVIILIDKNGVWYRKNVSERIVFFDFLRKFIRNIFQYMRNKCYRGILGYSLRDFFSCCNNSYDFLYEIDVVFPVIHGTVGEDGTLQGFLKMRNIPFVGTGVLGSALSMDKDISKRLLRDSGLIVAPFITLNRYKDISVNFEYCADILGIPLFVKPASQGSSIGVSKVSDSKSFYHAVNLAFNFGHKVLIESAIIGRELECAVLGNNNPQVSVCGEIILDNIFYTYQDKYSFSKNVKIIIPAKIDNTINKEIRYVVLRAFHILQCCGMARVDIFLTSDNRIIVNEVNTLPGFTINSMFPKLWEASGLDFKNLVSKLIDLALEAHREDMNVLLS